jgi:dolichyl-phosphooligosaccharide-protein glycotransferase
MLAKDYSIKYIVIGLLIVFFGVSLLLRIAVPFDTVFSGDWIKFTCSDAYYHMMLVDNMVYNLPAQSNFNPYIIYPGGGPMDFSFIDYLLAGLIWLISLGEPTQQIINMVGVYLPAILGAMVVIPVFFLGKILFNRWAGVLAAGLIAILPGEFLNRSILGYMDHHVAEILLSTTLIVFILLGFKSSGSLQGGITSLKEEGWSKLKMPVIYSILAGIFLGLYLLTWIGALLLIFILAIFLIVKFIINHLRGDDNVSLLIVGSITFLIAAAVFIPFSTKILYTLSIVVALFIPAVLFGISWLLNSKGIKPYVYPVIIIACGIAGGAIFFAVSPLLFMEAINSFSIFAPSGAFLTISEAGSILFPDGIFTMDIIWANFTFCFWISLIALGIIIYQSIKSPDNGRVLLIVWSLVILAATIGQRRFAYYLAINIAVLTGYCSWLFLNWSGFGEEPGELKHISRQERRQIKKHPRKRSTAYYLKVIAAFLLVIFIVYYPNIGPMPKTNAWPAGTKLAIDTSAKITYEPSNAWCDTVDWLNEETPEPFGDPNYYYSLHKSPFQYPESVYSVLSWWDYGYLISREAHRIPNTHPGQAKAGLVASILLTGNENAALDIIEKNDLKTGYLIIDYYMTSTKFYAIAAWAGIDEERYYEHYYYEQPGIERVPRILFYPDYYESLVVRLFNFDGEGVYSTSSSVVHYEERVDDDGSVYKVIIDLKSFNSYDEAVEYLNKQDSENCRIVGTSPYISPVDLGTLSEFKHIYNSKYSVNPAGSESSIPEVKVFQTELNADRNLEQE